MSYDSETNLPAAEAVSLGRETGTIPPLTLAASSLTVWTSVEVAAATALPI